jgi:hypothetical protein
MEKEKEVFEEKFEDMTRVIEVKTREILKLTKEKKATEEEMKAKLSHLVVEKELIEEEQKKIIRKVSGERQKETTKLSQNILQLREELEARQGECTELQRKVKEGERRAEKKSEELELVRQGQEEIRKKNEFRSNLERSFESLQKQFHAKADELERVKKELGHDGNKRRRTSKEIRHVGGVNTSS